MGRGADQELGGGTKRGGELVFKTTAVPQHGVTRVDVVSSALVANGKDTANEMKGVCWRSRPEAATRAKEGVAMEALGVFQQDFKSTRGNDFESCGICPVRAPLFLLM